MAESTESPASLVFKVTRRSTELVRPAGPTPKEFKELSDIDDQEGLRFHLQGIGFFKNDERYGGYDLRRRDPAKVIKDAVAKVLVPYYPLAGRLREREGRKLVVECTGEGIMFTEADADVTLDDFGDSLVPPFPCFEELLLDVPGFGGMLDSPLIHIQVTRLKCGGFIVALLVNHTMTDAYGLFQFMNAMAELARGAQSPSIKPVWERHLLCARDPPKVTCVHREFVELEGTIEPFDDIVHKSFFFGPTEISALRRLVPAHIKSSSTFEVLTACLWRCRTIAIQPHPEEQVRIIWATNARSRLDPPLPEGYYGNAMAFTAAISTADKLCKNSIGYALELVKKTKSEFTDEYMRSLADLLVIKGRPLINLVRSFVVSDVTQAGYSQIDFGWGPPVYSGTLVGGIGAIRGVSSFYIRHKNSKGENGIVVPVCLPASAMERFTKELRGMLNDVPEHPVSDFESSAFISSSL